MGLGEFPLGMGPMGADPVVLPPVVAPPFLPRAVWYDPTRKGFFLLDANGNATDVHPVDQIVALRLTMERGSSPSSPTVGTRIRARFASAPPQKYLGIAKSEVKNALQDLIDAGDITLLGVALSTNQSNGAQVVQATYVNHRDPRNSAISPQSNTVPFSI